MPMGGVVVDEEELEMDEESGRQIEMHNTLNQLNSLLKPDRRASKRQMPCGLGHSPHVDTSGSMDGVEFNMRLIREVRDRAFLYDSLAEAYGNTTWRISAWNDVAMGLECSADQVKTRWKTLRDKFKKEDKKVRAGESSNWMYYEAMEFLQPHLRDTRTFVVQHQQHQSFDSRPQSDGGDRKWRMEDQAMMKEMDDGPSNEKKVRMDEDNGAGGSQQPPIMVETEDTSEGATGGEERDERVNNRGSGGGDYHREMFLRMGNRHYAPHHHSPGLVRWNTQDEDEVFGHMIALRLAKMEPRFKEAVKVKLMQTLYEAQYGSDSQATTSTQ